MSKTIIFIGLSLLLSPVLNQASIILSTNPSQGDLRPINCEHNIARLDIAHDRAGKDGLIIFIARLGDGEFKQEFNRRRLHSARAYLSDYVAVRGPKTIVTAEGERVRGYGRVEIYVAGKLFDTLAVHRNADLSVGSLRTTGAR